LVWIIIKSLPSSKETAYCEEDQCENEVDEANIGDVIEVDGPFHLAGLCSLILILFGFGFSRLKKNP
jgi:hypothetical protein